MEQHTSCVIFNDSCSYPFLLHSFSLSSASGAICFAPSVLSGISLILSIFANSRCNLIQLSNDNLNEIAMEEVVVSLGLWCMEAADGTTYSLQDTSLGSKYDAARGLGLTTTIMGWLILIFYCIAGCVRFPPNVFRIIGFFAFLCCLFQGLVFLVFKSELCEFSVSGCDLDTGGKCGIAATVFWLLTSITSCAAGKKDDAEEEGDANPGMGDKDAEANN
jgi:hypothetical protein